MTSTDNFKNSPGNLPENFWRERAEISEGKRDEDDIPAFIGGHISNLARYSRIQMTVRQVSRAREYQHQDRLISAVAQATAAGLRVLTSLLPARFVPKSYFAYANSLSQGAVKTTIKLAGAGTFYLNISNQ